mmetsp:Transcript_5336/g.13427  ORF Transcript_5336/g.13427 Transcript_5336/m.13427 type:complete len:293 (-) Transcript_5336:58-936(-)
MAGRTGSRGVDSRIGSRGAQFDPLLDNTGHGDELASLEFEKLIGGPLCAVVKAQGQAALLTVTFVKEFGFTANKDGKASDPVYVEFDYEKPGLFGMPTKTKLKVPLITMLNVPALRVEYVEVEFLAKITSTVSANVDKANFTANMSSNSSSANADRSNESEYSNSDAKSRKWWGEYSANSKQNSSWNSTASMMATTTTQMNSKEGATVSKEFSIKVKVKATNDLLPAGLEKILTILEGQMKEDSGNKALMDKMLGGMGDAGPGGPSGGAGGAAPGAGAGAGAGGAGAEAGEV